MAKKDDIETKEHEYKVTVQDAQMISVGEDVYPVVDGKVTLPFGLARRFLDAGIVVAIPAPAQPKKAAGGKKEKQQNLLPDENGPSGEGGQGE